MSAQGEFESTAAEVDFTDREVVDALRDLDSWMAPSMESTPVALLPATSYTKPDPQGVVLIIGPFNCTPGGGRSSPGGSVRPSPAAADPLHLAVAPLVGALAAGNCAVVKPSELTASTSKLLAELLPKYVDHRCVSVVEGEVPETQALLAQRWDHIFFTGSERVGKIVMRAASEHLTKVRARAPSWGVGPARADAPACAGDAGTGRQEPRDRGPPVRGPAPGRAANHVGQVHQRWPDLHRARLRPRPRRPARHARGRAAGGGPRVLRPTRGGQRRLLPHRDRAPHTQAQGPH